MWSVRSMRHIRCATKMWSVRSMWCGSWIPPASGPAMSLGVRVRPWIRGLGKGRRFAHRGAFDPQARSAGFLASASLGSS
eukprot:10716601-Alexandrium_andersonii.AAC.1